MIYLGAFLFVAGMACGVCLTIAGPFFTRLTGRLVRRFRKPSPPIYRLERTSYMVRGRRNWILD